jgi:hypothetical protein
MGSKLGVGDIGKWFLISLQASHPCPRRPRQGLYRHLPATTPGHRQRHQVFGTLINYSFKSLWQFNSKWPAIALWFQVPGRGMEEPAGLSSRTQCIVISICLVWFPFWMNVHTCLIGCCNHHLLSLCLFWKSRSRRSHLYLLCLYHFWEGQKGAHKVLQVNIQNFFSCWTLDSEGLSVKVGSIFESTIARCCWVLAKHNILYFSSYKWNLDAPCHFELS